MSEFGPRMVCTACGAINFGALIGRLDALQ
jgi:hypothetical protein